MNEVSLNLESDIRKFSLSMSDVHREAEDIVRTYFATNASALVSALASGSTPATQSTGLTKDQFVNMIGCLQQVEKFFENQAVTTGDYLNNILNVMNGEADLATPLSGDVEALGLRIKNISGSLLSLYKDALNLVEIYNISELGTALANVSAHVVVFGCSTTRSKFLAGIVLMEQFSRMLGNLSVTQADYSATVSAWVS